MAARNSASGLFAGWRAGTRWLSEAEANAMRHGGYEMDHSVDIPA
jgi:hypothetical protein